MGCCASNEPNDQTDGEARTKPHETTNTDTAATTAPPTTQQQQQQQNEQQQQQNSTTTKNDNNTATKTTATASGGGDEKKAVTTASEQKVFLDQPIQVPDHIPLPTDLPGLNRDKSIWVLGTNKKAHAAPVEQYIFIKRLGNPGQFGEAWLAKRKKDGLKVAIKKIAKGRFMKDPKRAAKYLAVFSAEIQIMQRLDHKYCIKFYEAFEDSNYLYMAMELCTGGELFDRIIKKKKHTEKEAARTLKMLFEGLRYIHKNGLAHCDLKPDNFLFRSDDEDSPIKIIDFGMAKPVPPHEYHNNFCGTPYYVAPEVLRQDGYNQSCDLWSMGVIMFLMIFGFPPFHSSRKDTSDSGHRDIFRKIRKGFKNEVRKGYGPWFPEHIKVSKEAMDLMGSLMCMDTTKRITAEEALNHPWFKKAENLNSDLDDRVLLSLKEFRRVGHFKQMLLTALVAHIDDNEVAMLEKVLKELDQDGDGYLSVGEIENAFNGTLASQDIKRIAEAADIKGDEVISIEELSMIYLDRKVGAKEERLWQAFTKLDKTGDMKLGMDEIKKAIREAKGVTFSDAEIEEAFNKADLDGNGHIDYDEFLLIWGSKNAPPRRNSHAYRVMSSQRMKRDANGRIVETEVKNSSLRSQ